MYEYYPLLILGGIIGIFSLIFLVAYLTMKDKKQSIGFDRHMKDSEIVKRLLRYARPHYKSFLLVLLLMTFSIAYDIIAPLLIGNIEELIKNGQVATQYVDMCGNPTYDIKYNPNNSVYAIEGITSPDGRVFGKMGHSERTGNGLYKNVLGNYDIKMFESAVKYFK